MTTRDYGSGVVCLVVVLVLLAAGLRAENKETGAEAAPAQGGVPPPAQPLRYAFAAEAALVSKYIWRGQRATNDWSLQPSGTVTVGKFSFNIWGNLDLAAVNEGDLLPIAENPAAGPGAGGLRGQFSEVNYVTSFSHAFGKYRLNAGTITYLFPERSIALPATTEVYAGLGLDLPLAPSATLFVDLDETAESGERGLYLQVAGSHSLPVRLSRIPVLTVSGWVAFANGGFGSYFYGEPVSGPHDINLTLTAPVTVGEKWSASAFIAYSTLLGDFRNFQLRDAREVYRGTAGTPAAYADTLWGGVKLNLGF